MLRLDPSDGFLISGILIALETGFDSRRYQIFEEVVYLERGPLGLVRIIEELLEERKAASPGLENRD
jgi:hypothetical protein